MSELPSFRAHAQPPEPSPLQNLADIGTFVASIANAGLVVFALVQIFLLRRQVRLAQDQTGAAIDTVAAARESVETARDAVAESARVRVDERAPRVIGLMEEPQWPPLVDQTRSGMPHANDMTLLHHRSLAASADASPAKPFVFDGQRDWFMWFKMRGVLINEGAGTARVTLDGESQFVEGKTTLLPDRGDIAIPPVVGTKNRQQYLLRPGEVALFEWGYGHTLGEWADAQERPDPPNSNGACFLTIGVVDSFEHGVIDHIYIVMAGRPLVPVPGALGQWKIPEEPAEAELGITVYPIHRTYRAEGWTGVRPSWEETYRTSKESS